MQYRNELIFISGGVRSGKSAFAEGIAIQRAKETKKPLNYIATSKVEDSEMKERILRHQKQRVESGVHWKTFEIPNHFPENIKNLNIEGVVLLDCLTVLLANELFATLVPESEITDHSEFIAQNIIYGITALREKVHTLVIVSNEIHHELIDDVYVAAYQRTLGRLHQRIVEVSSSAFLVEATIPQQMK